MYLATLVALVEYFHQSGESAIGALRLFKKKNKCEQDIYNESTVKRQANLFYETRRVHDYPRSDRPPITEETVEKVKAALEQGQSSHSYHVTSARSVAARKSLPVSTVNKVLKYRLQLYPYHLHIG